MQFEISKYRQLIFSLLILIFSFSILAYLIFAWTPPTQSPPQGNVPAPINVGAQNQVKSGGIGAATVGTKALYLSPTSPLSGVNGLIYYDSQTNKFRCFENGSWKDCLGGGFWAATGNNIYNTNSGNVGIGTTNPTQKLDVAGRVKAAGFCIGTSCITSWSQICSYCQAPPPSPPPSGPYVDASVKYYKVKQGEYQTFIWKTSSDFVECRATSYRYWGEPPLFLDCELPPNGTKTLKIPDDALTGPYIFRIRCWTSNVNSCDLNLGGGMDDEDKFEVIPK